MRSYRQLTSEERYALSALRKQGHNQAEIARTLGRDRSTISREVRRNVKKDQAYRPALPDDIARWRRSRSRRNQRIDADAWALVVERLELQWSPDQIAGRLRRLRRLRISHETIYRYVWLDRHRGGSLHRHLRCSPKKRRKRYGSHDSRGRLSGKRHISERPPGAQNRSRVGHLEGDTVLGSFDKHCILTLVDRKTGHLWIGKLRNRTVAETNRCAIELINNAARPVRTLTFDNGTEFHGYKSIEAHTGVSVFFATPHHSWERGSNENTNGLIRQYLPKRKSMADLTQADCDSIANRINDRPRRRLDYRTPGECYDLLRD